MPADLQCPICKDILKDAIMMPCCAGEFNRTKGTVTSTERFFGFEILCFLFLEIITFGLDILVL